MTALYNVLERVRELENGCDVPPLSAKEKDIHEAGLVSVLKEIHDEMDSAVFKAYGWSDLIPALVGKPGATMPSPHKTPEQEEAEEEVACHASSPLNQERVAEERRGIVRWLRPDYQNPETRPQGEDSRRRGQAGRGGPCRARAGGRQAGSGPRTSWTAFAYCSRDAGSVLPPPLAPEALSAAFRGTEFCASAGSGWSKVLHTLVAAGVAQQGHRRARGRQPVLHSPLGLGS